MGKMIRWETVECLASLGGIQNYEIKTQFKVIFVMFAYSYITSRCLIYFSSKSYTSIFTIARKAGLYNVKNLQAKEMIFFHQD